jgi:RNA polymerase sigma-70 factor (ECF subfamily)
MAQGYASLAFVPRTGKPQEFVGRDSSVKSLTTLALSWESGSQPVLPNARTISWATLIVDHNDAVSLHSTAADVTTLFNLHYARLVRSLTVICGNSEEAADAVQEAFVKAHLKWRKISTYDDPVGWIRRVAINKVRDSHRSRVRRDRVVERLSHQPDAVSTMPEIDEISDLLATLPKQQRAVAAMFYVEQLSVLEIAEALEISEGAVKFHLHQAREKLRAHIESSRAAEESEQ